MPTGSTSAIRLIDAFAFVAAGCGGSSSDHGASFGSTEVIVANSDDGGPAHSPSIALADDALLVTWMDRTGAHLLVRRWN